jgi:hypothetical protein
MADATNIVFCGNWTHGIATIDAKVGPDLLGLGGSGEIGAVLFGERATLLGKSDAVVPLSGVQRLKSLVTIR